MSLIQKIGLYGHTFISWATQNCPTGCSPRVGKPCHTCYVLCTLRKISVKFRQICGLTRFKTFSKYAQMIVSNLCKHFYRFMFSLQDDTHLRRIMRQQRKTYGVEKFSLIEAAPLEQGLRMQATPQADFLD